MRQALILAAGCGRRLNGAAGGRTKCLLSVGGQTLIEHQLAALDAIGIDEACVVVGCCADEVRELLGPRCAYVLNPRWAETNSLYSLWLARTWVRGELFVLNCDVLAHVDILRRMAAFPGSCLAYDASSGRDDEQMKVQVSGGLLHAISKGLPAERSSGENVGLLRLTPRDAGLVLRSADVLVTAGGDGLWAPAAIDRLVPRLEIRCMDVSDLPWVEIDFARDLNAAREVVWPAIRDSHRPPAIGRSWRISS